MRELKNILKSDFFRETKIDKNSPTKEIRDTIKENSGKVALFKSEHYPEDKYFLAIINPVDKEYFSAMSLDEERFKFNVKYSELQKLIIANH